MPPKRMNPIKNNPASPMTPRPAVTASPPMKKPIGTVREKATFLRCGDFILVRATNPAGKKEAARRGCRKMNNTIHGPETIPSMTVAKPEVRKTAFKVFLTPRLSVTHPARKMVHGISVSGDVAHNYHNCCLSREILLFMAIAMAEAPTPNLLAISAIEIPISRLKK